MTTHCIFMIIIMGRFGICWRRISSRRKCFKKWSTSSRRRRPRGDQLHVTHRSRHKRSRHIFGAWVKYSYAYGARFAILLRSMISNFGESLMFMLQVSEWRVYRRTQTQSAVAHVDLATDVSKGYSLPHIFVVFTFSAATSSRVVAPRPAICHALVPACTLNRTFWHYELFYEFHSRVLFEYLSQSVSHTRAVSSI